MSRVCTRIFVLLAVFGVSFSVLGQAGMAQAINYDLDYSDPASDVTWAYENGTTEMMTEPKDVNIKWLRSEMQSGNDIIKLTIELSSPGQIRTDNVTVYTVNIYTTIGNASHFVVNYTDGNCTLGTNITTSPVNSSVQYSISGGELDFFVNVSDLSGINYYNIDASAETREYENATVGWVLKKDYGWELPGNPGTTPEDTPEGGTPGFELWTIAAAAISAMCVIAVLRRGRR